jgi:hypothetical protein
MGVFRVVCDGGLVLQDVIGANPNSFNLVMLLEATVRVDYLGNLGPI